MENEQRTYGIAEWAATLRERRTEKELAALAAVTREREAARSGPKERQDRPESIGAPTRHEEVSVERVLLSGEASEAEIGEDEVVVPVELYKIG